ncbi:MULTISPECIES: hypothetical protein [Crateriforma]|uniref:Methylmalonyl-CoA carboxyltransferase 12S subunit n=1 Tax=Crateriforma conspicua TaxID=2527996 RepID=A0A5C6FSY6_9PLAN|nr:MULTISPECIES: hypothetical protein [Crateriforma]TWU65426.1 hypothetical protein V7x_09730 [Crateriforma conspicua]
MTDDQKNNDEIVAMLKSLRQDIQGLQSRVASLEKAMESVENSKPPIDEQRLMIISSAIAAYLGVKPQIRQIRLISSKTWAHQGRATIHASHALAR